MARLLRALRVVLATATFVVVTAPALGASAPTPPEIRGERCNFDPDLPEAFRLSTCYTKNPELDDVVLVERHRIFMQTQGWCSFVSGSGRWSPPDQDGRRSWHGTFRCKRHVLQGEFRMHHAVMFIRFAP